MHLANQEGIALILNSTIHVVVEADRLCAALLTITMDSLLYHLPCVWLVRLRCKCNGFFPRRIGEIHVCMCWEVPANPL